MTQSCVDSSAAATLPADEPILLRVRDLAVGYPSRRGQARTVLARVNATLVGGELACLVGPNGSGKSTLLRSVAGLQTPLGGEVALAGRAMAGLGRRQIASTLAVVLTDRFEPGRLRVVDVVAMGRHPATGWSGRLTDADRHIIDDCLSMVGVDALAEQELAHLSDGQRQRVMVARALAQQPRVLLLDEPTAFLDPPARLNLIMLLRRVAVERTMAVLVCTHDIELASRYADRLWVADPDGSLLVGTPEELAYTGRLAASFATEGVEFDLASLAFVASRRDTPVATLAGDGPAAHLAGHALRRAGFRVAPSPQPSLLRVHAAPGRWSVTADELTTVHRSLAAFARHAQELNRDAVVVQAETGGCDEATVRVALLHLAPSMDDPAANLRLLLDSGRDAAEAGAQIILAPELAVSGYGFDDLDSAAAAAQTVDGPAVTAMAELSHRHQVYCVFGLLERDSRTGVLYNTAVATGPHGTVLARHRKLAVAERRWASAGIPDRDPADAGTGSLFTTPWGTVGLLVCADSYWGAPARTLALRGADLLLVLANWPPMGLDPRLVWRARALDNGVALVVCNRTGKERSLDFQDSRSYVVDAEGGVLLDTGNDRSTTYLVELPLADGRFPQRRDAALSGRRLSDWAGLALQVAAGRRNDYLWGAPPQCPVQVALALPEGSLRLEAPTSSDGDWLEAIADEHGPLLVTASGTEPLGSRTALVRMVGGCRVALTGIDRLRHPETAADLARRGVDLVAVPVGTDLDEQTWAAAATRCLERVAVAVLTPSRASLFLPPEGCEQWTEHTLTEPGRLSVPLDVAAGRDRHLFDRLDLETLCGPSGT